MNQIFTSTHWRDCTRNMLVNNERILYVERFQGDRVCYVVMFDNGQTIELDEKTGMMFVQQLERLNRPTPPIQYPRCVHTDRPRLPHRRRSASPSL